MRRPRAKLGTHAVVARRPAADIRAGVDIRAGAGALAAVSALAAVGALALSGSAGARPGPHPGAVTATRSPLAATRSHVAATRSHLAAARSHLQVTEVEYRLMLSRGFVRAGLVGLEAIDRGADPHNLRLRAVGSTGQLSAPELTSGRRWDGVVRLKPGVYHLWCSLPEHARLGMRATLTVVR
jgi:hypothetical protein